MPTVVRIIGGAGTGKTTKLLELMQKAIEAGGYDPFQIGFISFTRAARLEAAERASKQFPGVSADELQQLGWFRTIHSACFRLLEAKQDTLLSDSVKDREWLAEQLGEAVSGLGEGDADDPFVGKLDADRALSLWGTARNKLCSLAEVHAAAEHCDLRTPDLEYCQNIVEKYENAKLLYGRYDFTDLIGRYAGKRFTIDGARDSRQEGGVPSVPVWFLDEQQDTSALLDAAERRLVSQSRWVYLSLDPFQAIYGWNGAQSKHAMSWEVQKETILGKSFRCPSEIADLGEHCLKRCSDYWDRGIKPAREGGEVEERPYESSWTNEIDLDNGESWLLLGRTNFIARRLAKRIEPLNIPWVPTSGGTNAWNAPVRNVATLALIALGDGGVINGKQWQMVLKTISGRQWFSKGTKKTWNDKLQDELILETDLDGLAAWGASSEFVETVRDGRWHALIKNAENYHAALREYGVEAVFDPKIRIGTIHSAKGMEADNVVILRTVSKQIAMGHDFEEVSNEEHRLTYVAVTRARKRLLILSERNQPYKMEIL